MANFNEAFEILMRLEFNSPSNALHLNKTEHGLTYMGIYEGAHPAWQGWTMIKQALRAFGNIDDASRALYRNVELSADVKAFYKAKFWDAMRLDEISSQHSANEIFIFGVNAGCKEAVKLAQRVVGVQADGVVGQATINALNFYDEAKFDKEYDRGEIAFYNKIIEINPAKRIFANGWRNRAEAV